MCDSKKLNDFAQKSTIIGPRKSGRLEMEEQDYDQVIARVLQEVRRVNAINQFQRHLTRKRPNGNPCDISLFFYVFSAQCYDFLLNQDMLSINNLILKVKTVWIVLKPFGQF